MTLTREQIMSMEAGYELDVLVAENVMGWTKDTGSEYWLSQTNRIRTWEQTSYPGFQPSTDIAAAWEVAEKFEWTNLVRTQTRGFIFFIKPKQKGFKFIIDSDRGSVQAEALTAPEAICKAALLTLIKEEPA